MNKKEIAEKVLKSTVEKIIDSNKDQIVQDITRFNTSGETEESLAQKADLVKKYMESGMDFGEACDQKDVYKGVIL